MARRNGSSRHRSRVGRGQRWTAGERARYLREFTESGLSAAAFVRQSGLPQSTFDLWRQEARHRRGEASARFARVEVVASGAVRSLSLAVRIGREVTAELTGLDGPTAVAVMETMLRARSR